MAKTKKNTLPCPVCKSIHTWPTGHGKKHPMQCRECGELFKAKDCLKATAKEKRDYEKRILYDRRRRKGKFLNKKAAQMKNLPTIAESVLAKKFDEASIEYEEQWIYSIEGFAGICDFYLPQFKVVVEVDGGYHLEEEQQVKDAEKDFVCLKLLHTPVLRLTNKQAMNLSIERIGAMIQTKTRTAKAG